MPGLLATIVERLHQWVAQATNSQAAQGGLLKKAATLIALLVGVAWMVRRIEQARAAERRAAAPPPLRDARGNILPPNIALNQHAPSPPPPPAATHAANDAHDVRLLSLADRFLSERGSRVRRQTVCLTLASTSGRIFQPSDAAVATSSATDATKLPTAIKSRPLIFQDAFVPILMSLAQHTTLYCVCIEPDLERQASLLSSLSSIALFDLGLRPHRVLFCSTQKGAASIVRNIEPNLCLDDNRQVADQLRPHLDAAMGIAEFLDATRSPL